MEIQLLMTLQDCELAFDFPLSQLQDADEGRDNLPDQDVEVWASVYDWQNLEIAYTAYTSALASTYYIYGASKHWRNTG